MANSSYLKEGKGKRWVLLIHAPCLDGDMLLTWFEVLCLLLLVKLTGNWKIITAQLLGAAIATSQIPGWNI